MWQLRFPYWEWGQEGRGLALQCEWDDMGLAGQSLWSIELKAGVNCKSIVLEPPSLGMAAPDTGGRAKPQSLDEGACAASPCHSHT